MPNPLGRLESSRIMTMNIEFSMSRKPQRQCHIALGQQQMQLQGLYTSFCKIDGLLR